MKKEWSVGLLAMGIIAVLGIYLYLAGADPGQWATFVLIGFTAFYALETRWLVDTTRAQLDESRRQVEEMRKQTEASIHASKESRRALVKPCLQASVDALHQIKIANLGLGPAISTRVTLQQKGNRPGLVFPEGERTLAYSLLVPIHWKMNIPEEVGTGFRYDCVEWKLRTEEPSGQVYKYRIMGTCLDAFGEEVPVYLLFDSEGRTLTEEEWE